METMKMLPKKLLFITLVMAIATMVNAGVPRSATLRRSVNTAKAGRITGGQPAVPGQFPYQVSSILQYKGGVLTLNLFDAWEPV